MPALTPADLDLLSAYLDNELSPDDRAALEGRLAADDALRAELAALRSVQDAVRDLPILQAPRDFRLDPAIYGQQRHRVRAERRVHRFYRGASALSALAAVITLALGLLFVLSSSELRLQSAEPALEAMRTTAGEPQVAALPTVTAPDQQAPTLTDGLTADMQDDNGQAESAEEAVEAAPMADDGAFNEPPPLPNGGQGPVEAAAPPPEDGMTGLEEAGASADTGPAAEAAAGAAVDTEAPGIEVVTGDEASTAGARTLDATGETAGDMAQGMGGAIAQSPGTLPPATLTALPMAGFAVEEEADAAPPEGVARTAEAFSAAGTPTPLSTATVYRQETVPAGADAAALAPTSSPAPLTGGILPTSTLLPTATAYVLGTPAPAAPPVQPQPQSVPPARLVLDPGVVLLGIGVLLLGVAGALFLLSRRAA